MQKTQITQLAENLRHELSATRRDFHMHPELSGQEQRTAGIVADKLREYGLKVSTAGVGPWCHRLAGGEAGWSDSRMGGRHGCSSGG
jgi:metal-dependent amidase/aminoacylase/carboxypeptidase family protein